MFYELPTRKAPGKSFLAMSFAVALLLVTACSASSARQDSSVGAGGQLIWGKATEADVLDPAISTGAGTWEFFNLTYEGLVGLDEEFRPTPVLAESWRQTSPTTYVFNIRRGVKFSNGREMTADDVVGSIKRVIDPKLASYWSGQLGMAKVEASGTAQVKITLKKPKTSFLASLAGSPAVVLPMRELNAGTFDPKKTLLGTGPFKVTAHSQNESWTFVRNPYYWQAGSPKVAKVAVRIMTDNATRAAALRNGSIDVTTFDTPDSVALLKGQSNVSTAVQASTDYYRLDVNAKSSIFRDDRLRQALSLSIDRNKIKDVALAGAGRPTAAVSVAFGGVCDPAAVPYATPTRRRRVPWSPPRAPPVRPSTSSLPG